METPGPTAPLAGWQVVVLRPAGTAGALLRALRAAGATPLPFPALRLAPPTDPARAQADLARALAADCVLFTSPAAVAAARRLPGWRVPGGRVAAVGQGSARALRRAGVGDVQVPAARSDSEGVLALPALHSVAGRSVGLVTAPGGRGLIAATLAARGARVLRADVYRRLPPRFDLRHRRRLQALGPRVALLLSSAEALRYFLDGLAPDAAALLARTLVVAASPRLADVARAAGAGQVEVARSAVPADLLDALLPAAAARA